MVSLTLALNGSSSDGNFTVNPSSGPVTPLRSLHLLEYLPTAPVEEASGIDAWVRRSEIAVVRPIFAVPRLDIAEQDASSRLEHVA